MRPHGPWAPRERAKGSRAGRANGRYGRRTTNATLGPSPSSRPNTITIQSNKVSSGPGPTRSLPARIRVRGSPPQLHWWFRDVACMARHDPVRHRARPALKRSPCHAQRPASCVRRASPTACRCRTRSRAASGFLPPSARHGHGHGQHPPRASPSASRTQPRRERDADAGRAPVCGRSNPEAVNNPKERDNPCQGRAPHRKK